MRYPGGMARLDTGIPGGANRPRFSVLRSRRRAARQAPLHGGLSRLVILKVRCRFRA